MDTANTEAPADQEDRCTQLILIGQPMLKGERAKYLSLRVKHLKWLIENSSQNPVLSVFESIYLWEEHEQSLNESWEKRLVGLTDPISLYHAACFYEQRNLEKCLDLLIAAFQTHLVSQSALKHAKSICWGIEQAGTTSDAVREKTKILRRTLPSDFEYTKPLKENARVFRSVLHGLASFAKAEIEQFLPKELRSPSFNKRNEEEHFKSSGSAEFYYAKGIDLKNKGYAERAKDSMRRAINYDDGDIGAKAALYLRTHLPLHTVTPEAERLNIKGYNLMMVQKNIVEAEAIFKHCVDYFPEFEWPYCNLGELYMDLNQNDKAIKYLEKALTINPQYTNAMRKMSLAYTAIGEHKKAVEYMKSAAASFPDDNKLKEEADRLESIN